MLSAIAEPLYMLMIRVKGEPPGAQFWAAAKLEGHGRKLTRAQAEDIAARTSHGARFLFRATKQRERFAAEESPRPLAMLEGETIWNYGEPTYVDMMNVLRTVMDGAHSPDPDAVLLPVDQVLAAATASFGEADAHTVETAFDALVIQLGGRREGEPPAYRLSIARLLGTE
jgi:hypothetical protein